MIVIPLHKGLVALARRVEVITKSGRQASAVVNVLVRVEEASSETDGICHLVNHADWDRIEAEVGEPVRRERGAMVLSADLGARSVSPAMSVPLCSFIDGPHEAEPGSEAAAAWEWLEENSHFDHRDNENPDAADRLEYILTVPPSADRYKDAPKVLREFIEQAVSIGAAFLCFRMEFSL